MDNPLTGETTRTVELKRASTITTTPVRYLWRGRLAEGKQSILDGDGGVGKSTLVATMIAAITTGGELPGGPRLHRPRNVLYLSFEDDWDDTIVYRLEAAGADLSRVWLVHAVHETTVVAYRDGAPVLQTVPRQIELPVDMDDLEQIVVAQEIDFLVIDPLEAIIGDKVETVSNQGMRRVLVRLHDLQSRTGLCVLSLRNLNKMQSQKAIYRGGGAGSILWTARFGMFLGRHPDESDQFVLTSTKVNTGPMPPAEAFYLEPVETGVTRVVWTGMVGYSADQVADNKQEEDPDTSLAVACKWLNTRLVFGPLPVKEIEAMVAAEVERTEGGRKKGPPISWRTVRRAKDRLGVQHRRVGYGTGGFVAWFLPSYLANDTYLAKLEEDLDKLKTRMDTPENDQESILVQTEISIAREGKVQA